MESTLPAQTQETKNVCGGGGSSFSPPAHHKGVEDGGRWWSGGFFLPVISSCQTIGAGGRHCKIGGACPQKLIYPETSAGEKKPSIVGEKKQGVYISQANDYSFHSLSTLWGRVALCLCVTVGGKGVFGLLTALCQLLGQGAEGRSALGRPSQELAIKIWVSLDDAEPVEVSHLSFSDE